MENEWPNDLPGKGFDAAHPNSRTLSTAHLNGAGCSLSLWGYGEEMPLKAIELPFAGDAWWYPKNTYWQMTVDFGQGVQQIGGGRDSAASNLRPADRSCVRAFFASYLLTFKGA